jgi:hypothetical protein
MTFTIPSELAAQLVRRGPSRDRSRYVPTHPHALPALRYGLPECGIMVAMVDSTTVLLRQHVERWRRAGAELALIRERELRSVDTREAIRQMFGDNKLVHDAPRLQHSGLVEQQRWFAKLRKTLLAG